MCDFLSFYLSNIVRCVFQNSFVFMPCQVIMGKTNFPARRVSILDGLHVCSSASKEGCQFQFREEEANDHKHERMRRKRRKCLLQGNAANLHLIRGTLMYLIQHISHDVTSLLFFSAFVCVYCIHERYCPLPHSATSPSFSTHTHTTHYVPVVPHKAVAEVSKRANYRRLVAVTHGSQSKSMMDQKVVGGSTV